MLLPFPDSSPHRLTIQPARSGEKIKSYDGLCLTFFLCLAFDFPSLTKDIIKFHLFTHVSSGIPGNPSLMWRSVNFYRETIAWLWLRLHPWRAQIKSGKCFCLSIYNWSNLYKNLSDTMRCFVHSHSTRLISSHLISFPVFFRPLESSPSILMCTWIWQCHVNLIKLNEKRREGDEKQQQRQKTYNDERKNFSWRFQSEGKLNRIESLKQEKRVMETEKDRERWNGN